MNGRITALLIVVALVAVGAIAWYFLDISPTLPAGETGAAAAADYTGSQSVPPPALPNPTPGKATSASVTE